jgi:hypothetical protein
MNPDVAPPGNGLLLFFRVDDYEMALKRAGGLDEAKIPGRPPPE